jgi:hypothetical protein
MKGERLWKDTCEVQIFRRIMQWLGYGRSKIRIEYTYGQLYMYIQGGPFQLQTPAHWNLIGRSMTARPPDSFCYRPAVFFRNFSLTELSFPHAKIRRAFQKSLFKFFFFYILKMSFSQKLRKSESLRYSVIDTQIRRDVQQSVNISSLDNKT